MSSYNIDEDPYYQAILNGGDAPSANSWGSAGDTYGSQTSGGDFNFGDHSDIGGGITAVTQDDDEFGDLEVPEGGFGEPQTYEEMLGKPKDVSVPAQEDGEQVPSTEPNNTELQGLQQALKDAREDNANLLSQVNAAPKPWPTKFLDLPEDDPISIEVNGLLGTAARNYDIIQGNADYYQGQLNEALEANGRLQTSINNMNAAPNPLQGQLNAALAANLQLQTTINSLRAAPNPLAAQYSEAVAANGRLQATIDGLHSAPNPLQTQLDDAVAANGRLQATINALESALNPSDDERNSKNQEIEDLRKEIQRLMGSESNWKKQAEELETNLGTANQQIEVLQQTIDTNTTAANTALKAKEDLLNAAEFKLSAASRKAETLEKEVRKPQAENEIMLEQEVRVVREENKGLRRANIKLVLDANKEVDRLREVNRRLALKLNEPSRKIMLAEADLTLQKIKRQAEAMAVVTEKKKPEKEKRGKKEPKEQQEEVVTSVPGGWNDNFPFADPFHPSSADLVDAASSPIHDNVSRKASYVQEAALHAKYAARASWQKVKNTLFWLLLLVILFLSFFGKDVFPDETPADNTFTKRVVEEASATSNTSSWVVGGVFLVLAFVFAVYQRVRRRKAEAERRKCEEADRQLQAAVQADCLVRQQAELEEKQRVVERWQESARQLPPYYFESMRTGWTPPRRIYHGNNL